MDQENRITYKLWVSNSTIFRDLSDACTTNHRDTFTRRLMLHRMQPSNYLPGTTPRCGREKNLRNYNRRPVTRFDRSAAALSGTSMPSRLWGSGRTEPHVLVSPRRLIPQFRWRTLGGNLQISRINPPRMEPYWNGYILGFSSYGRLPPINEDTILECCNDDSVQNS